MELGRNARSILSATGEVGPCPTVDFAQVHAAVASTASKETIANSKAELIDWEKRYQAGWEFVRWPVRSSSARDFLQRWTDAFAPLRGWVAEAALCVAAEVQRDFRDQHLDHHLRRLLVELFDKLDDLFEKSRRGAVTSGSIR